MSLLYKLSKLFVYANLLRITSNDLHVLLNYYLNKRGIATIKSAYNMQVVKDRSVVNELMCMNRDYVYDNLIVINSKIRLLIFFVTLWYTLKMLRSFYKKD